MKGAVVARIGNPDAIREGLLRLLHRSTTHCELRSPAELLMLTDAYANILHLDRPRIVSLLAAES